MKRLRSHLQQEHKGQSFMELAIVAGVLLLLMVGMVEFSVLLNQYITVVDAAREGARYGSSGKIDPYIRTTSPFSLNSDFFTQVDNIIEGSLSCRPSPGCRGALDPIILNPATDDVVITFYRIANHSIDATYGPWHSHTPHASQVTDVATIVGAGGSPAPDSGVLVVEIFYAYNQLLNLPIFSNLFPNPINVHTYSIMPLSLAKPTPGPTASP